MDNVIDPIRRVLETTASRWETLTDMLPADLLTQQPVPGEWSPVECLQHLIDTETVFPFRVQCLLDGRDFPGFDPDSQGTKADAAMSPADLATEFARRRGESLKVLDKVSPGDLSLTVRHQELGMVTMSELLNEWAAHDLNHTIQAEQALMQPFIQGCGPWQPYFTEHVVGQ